MKKNIALSNIRILQKIILLLKKTGVGRVIYRLKLIKLEFSQRLQKSNGNQISLSRIVNQRRYELMSAHSVSRHSRKHKHFTDLDTLPVIDISVVTYNNGEWAEKFIKTLKAQSFPLRKINLLFIDNSSSDSTFNILEGIVKNYESYFANISLKSRPNLGFGAGHHTAIADSNSDFILVSNIDIEFRSDTILNLVLEAINDEPEVASWEVRQIPFEHPKYVDPVTLQVSWSSHCAILLRRTAYEAVGGYDPAIFMYGEDVELSYRLISRGWKLRYVPDAVLVHHTYKVANEIKPIQFVGSIYANGLIRIRYGSFKDLLTALMLQIGLLLSPLPIKNVKLKLIKNFLGLLLSIPRERMKKTPLRGTFPFRAFDYDMRRDGAFYDLLNTEQDGPMVSVITRTYKGREYYLKECIVSVLNQTYKNIEHIIIEDGGDSHKALVEKIQESYSGSSIHYFSQEKLGRSAAGNMGLSKAQGKWCIFLDDDDLFLPDHIEILANELINNEEVSAAYSLAWEVKTDITSSGYSEKFYVTEPVFYQEYSQETLMHHNYIPIQCILFSRDLFLERGGFDESLDQLEDWNLWVKYSINKKFKWVCKTTSLYRTPYSSLIATRRKELLDKAYPLAIEKNQKVRNISSVSRN